MIAAGVGIYVILRYLFPYISPFLLSFCIVYLLNPWLERTQKRTRIRKEYLLVGILTVMILIMLLLLWLILQLVATQMGNLTQNWEGISTAVNGRIRIFLGDCCMFAEEHFGVNAAQSERSMLERMEVLVEEVRVEFLPRLMTESFWYVKKLVSAAAFLGITLIASILLCKDFDGLMERVQGLLESTGCVRQNGEGKRINILERIFRLAAVFLKTQGVLMLTVAGISSVGLLVGNITNAVILGLLSGLLDTLPFIGTGIVLIPTALWQLLCGRYTAAVWCIFVYILCVTVRELLEPRLMGEKIGIYPVFILFSVYAGIKLFGVSGILKGPLGLIVLAEVFHKR